ncbi:hypothetical protein M8C21_006284 [Ambrosia artemisiifolia]|uniref:Uncharacterized protein n=1 Tax=Ambrosia artemisiifolia TaxID=4212 RepID=A0AAD5CY40_AMBAR|nr:hypothetical protein M8C21_006284 [Ambrosia artemisiifolia]
MVIQFQSSIITLLSGKASSDLGYLQHSGIGNGQNQSLDRFVTTLIPAFMDPTVAYLTNGYYYYGGMEAWIHPYWICRNCHAMFLYEVV